jgi:hypothetical protein
MQTKITTMAVGDPKRKPAVLLDNKIGDGSMSSCQTQCRNIIFQLPKDTV